MRAGPLVIAAAVAALSLLAACGETAQTSDKTVKKSATPAWAVSTEAVPAYSAEGYRADGDRAAWEAQINARTQGQNDYAAR